MLKGWSCGTDTLGSREYLAETRNRARALCLEDLRYAGYQVPYIDVRAIRFHPAERWVEWGWGEGMTPYEATWPNRRQQDSN